MKPQRSEVVVVTGGPQAWAERSARLRQPVSSLRAGTAEGGGLKSGIMNFIS